jgi:UDP-2,3-diacylglucosamine hydrolase
MLENGVQLLIHGHTHRPAVHDLQLSGKPARRIVLGDWDKQGWYLRLDGDSQALVSFEIPA